ncbi:DJ-1/PfpI family protein [Nonomuraea sp. NPDC049646]
MGRPVRCDSGLELPGQGRIDTMGGPIDTLIVSGGQGHETAAANPRFVSQVMRLAGLSRRVASVCTGATVLAAAGLLDNRRATTHWYEAGRLAARFPHVRVLFETAYVCGARASEVCGLYVEDLDAWTTNASASMARAAVPGQRQRPRRTAVLRRRPPPPADLLHRRARRDRHSPAAPRPRHRTHQRAKESLQPRTASALCTQDLSQRQRPSTGSSTAGTARPWSGRRTWCWSGARQERATG